MACNLTGLFKKCFYIGWVGDHGDKAYKAKDYRDIFEEEKDNCLDSGVSSDEEDCRDFTEAELFPVTVVVEPDNKYPENDSPAILELDQADNTNKVVVTQVHKKKSLKEERKDTSALEEELVDLLEEEGKEKAVFSMFDSDESCVH